MVDRSKRTRRRQHAYIDGRWCDPDDEKTFPVHNPETGEIVGR
jgi:acyl-CoA reductase-like NAD-dependent aldehyde dehydrogenase